MGLRRTCPECGEVRLAASFNVRKRPTTGGRGWRVEAYRLCRPCRVVRARDAAVRAKLGWLDGSRL